MCANRFKSYDKNGRLVRDVAKKRTRVDNMSLTWKIPKSCRNNETNWYQRNYGDPNLDVVDGIINMIARARELLCVSK